MAKYWKLLGVVLVVTVVSAVVGWGGVFSMGSIPDADGTTKSEKPNKGRGVITYFARGALDANDTNSGIWGVQCNGGVAAVCQAVVPHNGTLANLLVAPSQAPTAGAITKVSVNVNGVDTVLNITHTTADGASLKSNTVDSVSVSQGDQITVTFTETGGVQSPVYMTSFEFK